MLDYTKSRKGKSVLTKGIETKFKIQAGQPDTATGLELAKSAAEAASSAELRAIMNDPEFSVFEFAKAFAMDGETSTQAVYKALDVVESLVSDAHDKFTNLFSPGTVTAIIQALDRSRLTGWSNQNAVERVGPGFVSGGEDSKTEDYAGNPKSPGDGFVVGIGRDRYGSRSAGGSGEDVSPSKTTTSPTRYTGLGLQGGQQPQHPPKGPGRSGNYGHGSEVISSVGPDGKVMVKYHDHSSYKPNSNPAKVTTPLFEKLDKSGLRNEDIDGFAINKEYSTEELSEALRVRDGELRQKARERGDDEITLKARDPIRVDLQKRLNAKKLLQK